MAADCRSIVSNSSAAFGDAVNPRSITRVFVAVALRLSLAPLVLVLVVSGLVELLAELRFGISKNNELRSGLDRYSSRVDAGPLTWWCSLNEDWHNKEIGEGLSLVMVLKFFFWFF